MDMRPLAEKMRPEKLEEVIGQEELTASGGILAAMAQKRELKNLIFWGPPGTGKTTLARIMAKSVKAEFIEISAVVAGKKEIEKAVLAARQNWNLGLRTVLFVDEIHRFNKAQQDALLPHIESGLLILLGATTENPSFEIIAPLLSRSRVVILKGLKEEAILKILERAVEENKIKAGKEALEYLAKMAGGDARFALGILELAVSLEKELTIETIKTAAGKKIVGYDKNGDYHYHHLSALIKSLRAGSANATLYYLARILEAGEDPKIVARRMVVFASEDIGLAGNGALNLATSAFLAVERVGMPESGIILSHVAVALAKAKKSRTTYNAWRKAQKVARDSAHLPVPSKILNPNTKLEKELGYAKDYQWRAGFKPEGSLLPDELGDLDFFN